jgi:hypothetical protein
MLRSPPLYGLLAAWHRIYEPSLSRQILPRRYQSVQGKGLYKGGALRTGRLGRFVWTTFYAKRLASHTCMYPPCTRQVNAGERHMHMHTCTYSLSGIPSVVKNREDDVCRKFMTQQQAQMRAIVKDRRNLHRGTSAC